MRGLLWVLVLSCVRAGCSLLATRHWDHLSSSSPGLVKELPLTPVPPLGSRQAFLHGKFLALDFVRVGSF